VLDGSLVLALVVFVVGVTALGCYGLVRCAETLRSARVDLIERAADFNGRMAAQGRPHTWIVPAPSRIERAIYAVADRLSVRRRRRNRHAATVRAAMGGDL
jgi:hypothetical protein